MAIYGFLLIGFCFGMAVGMILMSFLAIHHVNENGKIATDAIRDIANKYKAELVKAYAEIERMQDTINNLQIERAKTMAKAEGFKDIHDAIETAMLTDYKPDWLKDFYDTTNVPEGNDDFGGITL